MVNCDDFLDVGVETTPTPRLHYYLCGGVPNLFGINPAFFKEL